MDDEHQKMDFVITSPWDEQEACLKNRGNSINIVEHYFSKRLGLAMGIACCGSGLGQFLLAPLLHLLSRPPSSANTLHSIRVLRYSVSN